MPATIAQQSADVSAGMKAQVPTEVYEVFDAEQSGARAAGAPSGTVAAGDVLSDFTLPDAGGDPVALGDLVADGPAVLVFFRGGWCPFCDVALRTYQRELLPELSAGGVRLVAISPQVADVASDYREEAGLGFPILSDAHAEVARTLGLAFQPADEVLAAQRALGLDITTHNAEASTDLPMPTVLVVDPDRRVRFADTKADYTQRTEVAEILAALGA